MDGGLTETGQQVDVFDVDVVIAGAGVVGLAIARCLAKAGRGVLILEKNGAFGEETSARNSEVIHAGIYYEPGSLKARHCRRGRDMLYRFCADRAVPFRRCGKLIVATTQNECTALSQIASRAAANGLEDLQMLSGSEARALEPALNVTAALHSPSTGIVDSHSFMLALLGEAEAHGAQLVLRAPISGGRLNPDGTINPHVAGEEPMGLRARSFINCAGLWAPALSDKIEGLPPAPPLSLVKGSYFSLAGKAPFSRLIYPAPRDGGLGIHLTLDLSGRAKFGPDTEWLETADPERLDYTVVPDRRDAFLGAIQTYWPDAQAERLHPDYAGVRPKIAGAVYPDFRIEGPDVPGRPHALLYGIESPGLTASLSIAEDVARMLR